MGKRLVVLFLGILVIFVLLFFFSTSFQVTKKDLSQVSGVEFKQALDSNAVLMWIGPHPDDELSVAGTIAYACKEKEDSCFVVCTGDIQNVMDGVDKNKRLEEIAWLKKNYLQDYIFLGNIYSETTAQDLPEIKQQIKNTIQEKNPTVIITYSPFGYYGHPQHKVVSVAVTQVISQLQNPPKLYYVINPDGLLDREYAEYSSYPPTDAIDLSKYSEKLGERYWDAKVQIMRVFADTVPLMQVALEKIVSVPDSGKKEYFMKVN